MFLEHFCKEICHKRVWFIVLFVFGAFKLIETQLDRPEEFVLVEEEVDQLRGASACAVSFSRSLAILNDRVAIVKFKRWFLKHENYPNKGCSLICFWISAYCIVLYKQL